MEEVLVKTQALSRNGKHLETLKVRARTIIYQGKYFRKKRKGTDNEEFLQEIAHPRTTCNNPAWYYPRRRY
jgi:hypothetical protein